MAPQIAILLARLRMAAVLALAARASSAEPELLPPPLTAR